jgi:predicted DNA-binding ribbon-helix-helix protein
MPKQRLVDVIKLQAQIRKSSYKRLQEIAEDEMVPVSVLIRRIVDEFVRNNPS